MLLCHGSLGRLGSEQGTLQAPGQRPQVLGFCSLWGQRGGDGPAVALGRTPKAHEAFPGAGRGILPGLCPLAGAGRPRSIPGHPLRSILAWLCQARPVLAPYAPVGLSSPVTCTPPLILPRRQPDGFCDSVFLFMNFVFLFIPSEVWLLKK